MIELALLGGFVAATIRIATPILFAAVGELIAERSGVLNLGIEGAMLCGALAGALAGSAAGPWPGLLAGTAAGAACALATGAMIVLARADQVITGTAVTLGAMGLTGAVYRATLGAGGRSGVAGPLQTLGTPWVLSVAAALTVPAAWWVLYRTRWGLALRAVGEDRHAAEANGVRAGRVQLGATLAAGALAGLGGATLVLAQVGSFAEKMTAGRGFIAIAIVVLGRWSPLGVLAASLLYAGLQALQFLLQGMGLDLPYQLFQMLPYLVTLAALAGLVGRSRAPAGLGK